MKRFLHRALFTSVATLLLGTGLTAVTTVASSAHVGDISVTKKECVDATSMKATYQVGWTNGTATGKLYQRAGLYGQTGNAGSNVSGWTFVKNVSGASGSESFTLTHAKSSFSGTNSANGPWWSSKVVFSDGYGVAADTRVEGFDWSSCNPPKVVEAKALCEHEINSTEWHFVATMVKDEASADKFITVTWDNGQTAEVPLEKFVGGVAHYTTTLNLGSNVTKAVMQIYDGWSGQFNLSHGPACRTKVPVPAKPGQNDPCGPNNAAWIVPNDTDSLDWTLQSDGRLTVSTKAGYVFNDGSTFKDFGKAVDSNEPCKTPIRAKPSYQDPCGVNNATWNVPADTDKLDWTLEADGDLVVATKPGYVFEDGTTSKNFGKAPDSGVKCTVPVPPAPTQNDPCGPNNAAWNVPNDTEQYDWTLRQDGHLVVTVKGDVTFPDGSTTKDYGLPTDSNEPCKVPVPAKPAMDDPCGVNNATWVKPADTASVVWVLEADGDLVAKTTPGYVFENGQTEINFGKAVDSNEPCPSTVVQPPTVPVVDDCGPGNAHLGPVPAGPWTSVVNPDGSVTITANPGNTFPNGPSVTVPAPVDSNVACPVPPQPKPKKVKGAVKKIDKCESYNFFYAKKVRGLHYVVKGKVVREGVWIRTHGKRLVVRIVADSDKYVNVGKKKIVLKFPNTRNCEPIVTPPTGL